MSSDDCNSTDLYDKISQSKIFYSTSYFISHEGNEITADRNIIIQIKIKNFQTSTMYTSE